MEPQHFDSYDSFAEAWTALGYNENYTKQCWALLGHLRQDERLVHMPDWLAEEKVGFVDGATPTAFIGRIDRETEKAVLFVDSAAARPLSKLAHRIQSIESGIERLEAEPNPDASRLRRLRTRLHDLRNDFNERADMASLSDEWLPKSQVEFFGPRGELD